MIFIGLTMLVLGAVWAVNNCLLENFYKAEKIKSLETAYTRIDDLVQRRIAEGKAIVDDAAVDENNEILPTDELAAILQEFSEKYNTSIVIIDSVNDKAILSSAKDGNWMAEKVQRYIIGQNHSPKSETIRQYDNYSIEKNFDMRSKSFFLESWGFFSDNSTMFIMSTPVASLRESVALSNKFLSYVGITAMICSAVIMYFASRMITSPILSLAAISEKMSELDFGVKYTGNAQDEIGVLGNSMNTMSEKLEETISELKTANNELQKDNEKKTQIDEMRKEFIANVSHELKTPIALIQGYAEGLTEGMCDSKESQDYYCEVIMDEANKMNKMVHQLLNLTALEFGNDAPVFERFDIVELIRGAITAAGILIQQNGANVIFENTEPVYVWADEFKIEEVVTNYLSNALNHLNGEKKIIIRLTQRETDVRISVYNTGQQISEEDLPNLWTKFFKVDRARTRAYGGSGIGLSIVKAIMDSHHKECGVHNIDDGVEFWFDLDCKSESC